jgi:hypothetical protein
MTRPSKKDLRRFSGWMTRWSNPIRASAIEFAAVSPRMSRFSRLSLLRLTGFGPGLELPLPLALGLVAGSEPVGDRSRTEPRRFARFFGARRCSLTLNF